MVGIMMYNYDIHGLLKVKSNFAIPFLHSSFLVPKMEEDADIEVYIDNSKINLDGLTPIGLRIFYSNDRFVHKCRFFLDTHLEIKECGKKLSLRFNKLYKQFRKPLEYFLAFFQMKLLEKGFALLHAACVSKNHEGLIFPAFSDTGKTTTALQFVNVGYKLLGDDMIITNGSKVLSFPTSMKKVLLRPFETIPLLRKLVIKKDVTPPIVSETIPKKIFFLMKGKENKITKIGKKDFSEKMNIMTESACSLFPFPKGVMLAYYFVRGIKLEKYLTKRERIISKLAENCQIWVVTARESGAFFKLIKEELNVN